MATTAEIATSIRNVGAKLIQVFRTSGWNTATPMTNVFGGVAPSISAENIDNYTKILAKKVERLSAEQLNVDGSGSWLGNMQPQIDQIHFNNINQNQMALVTNALTILQMIDAAVPQSKPAAPKVDWESLKDDKQLIPKDLKARLRSLALRIEEMEPQTTNLKAMIEDIENAHAAADQLPTTLADLEEQKQTLADIASYAEKRANVAASASRTSEGLATDIEARAAASTERLASLEAQANAAIQKSEQALRGSTSVGLSKSFAARREALGRSGMLWTGGLVVALLAAVLIGWERVSSLKDILNGDKSAAVVIVNAMLAVLGVGAPVWFAWLATKQIGTTFRLSEDYAFKASVAQAYEGFRAEAVDIDERLRKRLFASALDRFEEAPIRLIDLTYHSSPLQELLANPAFMKQLERVPSIAAKMIALLPTKGAGAAAAVPAAAVASAVAATDTDDDDGDDK